MVWPSRGLVAVAGARRDHAKRALTFVIPLLVIGAGAAFVYSPLLVTMRAVAPQEAAKASSSSSSYSSSWAARSRRRRSSPSSIADCSSIKRFWRHKRTSRLPVAQFLQQHGSIAQLAASVANNRQRSLHADVFVVTGALALIIAPGALCCSRAGARNPDSPFTARALTRQANQR